MTVQQVRALGPVLGAYLDAFADCFGDGNTRYHLKEYVSGQLSDLPRKSVEPIAHLLDLPPRTLQEFLSLSHWDEARLRDRLQQIVQRDHGEAEMIAIVDESGCPKKGKKTACVQRQYCGATGKMDNCVMTVQLCCCSFDGQFRAILDSDLYLPEEGWDPRRRREAGIPDALGYRPKYQIALEQLAHAAENGVQLAWVVADEWYGQKPAFIAALEQLGLRFVLQIPRNLLGWLTARAEYAEVQHLVRYSRAMRQQPWRRYHIKDSSAGALVWEVKAAAFWMPREAEAAGPYWLVAARDVLEPETIRYFLSNASGGVPLEVILHVGFSRWAVEQSLEEEKGELGLDQFEVRKYGAVLRHLRLTQLSHLFLSRQRQRLRGKKPGGDDLPGARGSQCLAGCVAA